MKLKTQTSHKWNIRNLANLWNRKIQISRPTRSIEWHALRATIECIKGIIRRTFIHPIVRCRINSNSGLYKIKVLRTLPWYKWRNNSR